MPPFEVDPTPHMDRRVWLEGATGERNCALEFVAVRLRRRSVSRCIVFTRPQAAQT